jgi:multidrug efflux pump subunit AcrB
VNHVGELPAVTISFGLRPGVSGSAVDRINGVAATILPPTVTTAFQGSAKVFQASMQNLGLRLYRHRRRLHRARHAYESYVHPLTILSGHRPDGALVTSGCSATS